MIVNRPSLESLVWRKAPAEMKVSASGAKWVMVGGKLAPLEALPDATLFEVLRRINITKTITKALEAA